MEAAVPKTATPYAATTPQDLVAHLMATVGVLLTTAAQAVKVDLVLTLLLVAQLEAPQKTLPVFQQALLVLRVPHPDT